MNKGKQILLRLRYAGDRNQFIPFDSVVDTMLHELCHMVHSHHHSKFNALWNQLRDEHLDLTWRGFSGEGFLSEGKRLGGIRVPAHEARRVAREAAEKRHRSGGGSGQRLGGRSKGTGEDMRKTIADAVDARNKAIKGCGTDKLSDRQVRDIADTATRNGFRTQAEEDEANEAAIAQALWELAQEDEKARYGNSYIRPSAENPTGNGGWLANAAIHEARDAGNRERSVLSDNAGPSWSATAPIREARDVATNEADDAWSCEACTLRNQPIHLCCDACGTQRPERQTRKLAQQGSRSSHLARQTETIDLTDDSPKGKARGSRPVARRATPPTWNCSFCSTVMESQWWTCSVCGRLKDRS